LGTTFFLEDFEDGVMNSLGLTLQNSSSAIVLPPGPDTDSVDADDGTIDGSGRNGYSLLDAGAFINRPLFVRLIEFQFDADVLGFHPTVFGFVWTDGPANSVVGIGSTNPDGVFVADTFLDTALVGVGDGTFDGGTSEDRGGAKGGAKGDAAAFSALLSFPWPSSWTQCVFELQASRGLADPLLATKRCAAVHTTPNRFQLAFCLRLVHPPAPVPWARNRPLREQFAAAAVSMRHSPRTAGFPILGTSAERCSDGIPLNVPQHGQQMVVRLDRKRFESSLVQMPGSLRMVMGMPTHGMGVRQPPEKGRKLVFGFRPDDKVPVIGHHAIREDRQRFSLKRLAKHPFERFVVLRFFE
jgi:hypothetical protein